MPSNQSSGGQYTSSQSWQAHQAGSGAFQMGQCQKTDRPSCILELCFPELFPGMEIQHRPSQISTLVPTYAYGSLESAVAPPVSLAFVFPPYSSSFSKTPGLVFDQSCSFASVMHVSRLPQGSLGPPSFLGVPWVLRHKGVLQ